MKSLVVTNGIIHSLEHLHQLCLKHQHIICADGAVRYLRKIDVFPTIVVGDLDSIISEDLHWIHTNDIRVIQYDTRKDFTDTEIAVRYALDQGALSVTMTGSFGSRMDHSLGNLYLLKMVMDEGCEGLIDEAETEVRLISSLMTLSWIKGETVSFIPISEVVKGVTLRGFEYPVTHESIRMGSSRCLSNVVAEDSQEVEVEQGLLAAIRNK
jgi:thiamine pyrophosphokinase